MIRYPMTFNVVSTATAGIQNNWETAPVLSVIKSEKLLASIPLEFEGPGGGFSPEDFYALALANCFIATFKVIAEKSKLDYSQINGKGSLTVDRDDNGIPWMKVFSLNIKLEGVSDKDRALRLLDKTSRSCMILNSVKTEKLFCFEISDPEA